MGSKGERPGAGEQGLPARVAEKLRIIPDRPGVYLMKQADGRVIYVGKAVSLRRRVHSYFQTNRYQGSKVARMVQEIADLEYIVTDSEVEALILESNLIKLHRPWFNVKLRDDKAYPYLKVTVGETYPRVLFVRRPRPDGSRYFGPYTDSAAVRDTLQWIRKLFAVRTCDLDLDKGQRLKRPCLMYYIGRCPGPCVEGLTTPAEYRQVVADVCLFLEGRHQKLLPDMEAKMKQAAAALDYERAARLRDRLQSLQKVVERQKIVSPQGGDRDVLGLAVDEPSGLACVAVLFVRDGKLVGRDRFFLDTAAPALSSPTPSPTVSPASATPTPALANRRVQPSPELQEILTAFLGGYYSQAGFVPPQIWLPLRLPPREERVWSQWLSQRRQELLAASGRAWQVAETVPTRALSSPDYTPDAPASMKQAAHRRRRTTGLAGARSGTGGPADSPEMPAGLGGKGKGDQSAAMVRLITPVRGQRYALIGLACENAQEVLRERLTEEERREAANQSGLQELQQVLGLADLPWRIECYDISNLQEKDAVAAMVVLEGGEPAPREYRKFRMRTPGPNDFTMMHEVIGRRFQRGLQERQDLRQLGLLEQVEKRKPGWLVGDARREPSLLPATPAAATAAPAAAAPATGRVEAVSGTRLSAEAEVPTGAAKGKSQKESGKFARLPDLVVVDGGPGQLGAARDALRELGLEAVPTIGLAKENEWVYLEDDPDPLMLPRHSPGLHLLQRVRDEAHRFGITFNRQLRGKRTLHSVLDDIPGVGPVRKRALIRTFGSVAGVRRATVAELAAVPGVPLELAQRIAEHLGNPDQPQPGASQGRQ